MKIIRFIFGISHNLASNLGSKSSSGWVETWFLVSVFYSSVLNLIFIGIELFFPGLFSKKFILNGIIPNSLLVVFISFIGILYYLNTKKYLHSSFVFKYNNRWIRLIRFLGLFATILLFYVATFVMLSKWST